MPAKSEDISCDGCLSQGRYIGYYNACEIRWCGLEKAVLNCAYCDEYACEKLTKFHTMAPHAGKTLEKIKEGS